MLPVSVISASILCWSRSFSPVSRILASVSCAAGAVLSGVIVGVALKALGDRFAPDLCSQIGFVAAGLLGFTLAIVGIIGDLVESLLKRDAEVKDTGALLPGMGGVLDRIDAHLLGIPTMYYLMLGYIYLQAR